MSLCLGTSLVFLASLASQNPPADGSAAPLLTPMINRVLTGGEAFEHPQGSGGETKLEKQQSAAVNEAKRIVVVVSKKNPIDSLTTDELARILLRKTDQWPNGWMITLYERPAKHDIRIRFSNKVLHKNPSALNEYWMNLQLTKGLQPPKVLRSAKLLKRYLARVKGGVGYMYEEELDDSVKAVKLVENKS
jgi:hypothetical protein